jgi:hypothetical protein
MTIDREYFFNTVRDDLFSGGMAQSQVDGMNNLLNIWETDYAAANPRDGDMWLSYGLATVYHESAQTMQPIEEYGQGEGHSYADPTGPYGQSYYGRGHVQLTWYDNYVKGEEVFKKKFDRNVPMVKYPHRMLEEETSAVILFEGMIDGWFTGVGLPDYFNAATGEEDPYNARKIINGLDRAETIEGYYWEFKGAIRHQDEVVDV